MRKRYALTVSVLVTLLVLGNYLYFKSGEIFPEREIVVIERVIDGDTVELDDGRVIRLLNINAPEKGRAFSEEATGFLKNFEGENIELDVGGVGKYGRILGRLYDKYYINLKLVELGLAHSYIVGDKELGNYKNAEKSAIDNNVGIWKKSEYYGCLGVEINKKDEYVSINNVCNVSIEGWTVKDESTKTYVIEQTNNQFILHSGKGVNTKNDVYWKRGNIWNNDKDSIFIRDGEGLLVYYNSYGY